MDGPPGGIEALDELLDLPHLNVLLRSIVLRHFGRPLLPLKGMICTTEKIEIQIKDERGKQESAESNFVL